MITIAAIDDDRMLLQGMASWLAGVQDIQLVATAISVDQYVLADLHADVVLLDLNLRDHSHPADNVTRLTRGGAKVLVMSTIPDPAYVIATTEAGADGYITKDHDLTALTDAIHNVMAGRPVITPELALVLSGDHRPSRPKLSPQERRVLTGYASGMTLEAAARRAGVQPGTAREYLARIKRKYAEAGRPTYTKLDLADRVREDSIDNDGLQSPPPNTAGDRG